MANAMHTQHPTTLFKFFKPHIIPLSFPVITLLSFPSHPIIFPSHYSSSIRTKPNQLFQIQTEVVFYHIFEAQKDI